MSDMTGFHIADREIDAEPLHYTLCGLDDIYLLNGFRRPKTRHGSGVAVEHADQLHRVIGAYLIRNRKALGPKDIKFLRKVMDLTQAELGVYLGVDGQTVARYEKGETEKLGASDLAIRLVYARLVLGKEHGLETMAEVVDAAKQMAGVDEVMNEPEYFEATSEGWNIKNKGGLVPPHVIASR